MSRRTTSVQPASRDGTSQRSRRLAALDPSHAPIDERTSADLLRFVQAYAERLSFLSGDDVTGAVRATGTWVDFVRHPDISVSDVVAYIARPERFTGDRARWLGRPHFALLLTFVELLGHVREQLNGYTRRHLDYYYRDLLQLRPEPPTPDRATVVFGLGASAAEHLVPAGTELQAGRDPGGVPRIYRTESDLVVNRAVVTAQRSIFVDRRVTGIPDVRADRGLTAAEAFARTLEMALGAPRPGQPVPPWRDQPIDAAFFVALRAPLDLSRAEGPLHLDHYELRSLMQLWHRRRDADVEWAALNRLLGVTAPADPRAFAANLAARLEPEVLDFSTDGLPQVDSVDDLYTYRTDRDVRAYIDAKLGVIGFDNFIAAMQIKLRIDADWAEINRLVERVGRRRLNVLRWSLPPGSDPTRFSDNLKAALGGAFPAWPWGAHDIDGYEALLRDLEVHLSMPIERILTLVAFAEELGPDSKSEAFDWSDVDRILADAYRELKRATRRTRLAQQVRGAQTVAAFDAEVSFVLGKTPPIAWAEARGLLAGHLTGVQLDLLARFREAIATGHPIHGFSWSEVDRLCELVWRDVQQLPDQVAQQVEIHNVYAYDDAAQVKSGPAAPGWRTFGARPADADDRRPRGATLGFAVRSPLLSLSEGTRTITVTLGLRDEGFTPDVQARFEQAIGVSAARGVTLAAALAGTLVFEVTTAKGWLPLRLASAQLEPGTAGHDYWSLIHAPRALAQDRPGLQLVFVVDPDRDGLAPLKGDPRPWPTLRVSLKPRWVRDAKEWRTSIEAFEPLVLEALHLQVLVDGLAALRLQQDDRALDPKKPFEPFGSRPAVGARLYIAHPELTRARLDTLRFDVTWMGLPGEALETYYTNYPGLAGDSTVFKVHISLVDGSRDLGLADLSLFEDRVATTLATRSLAIAGVPDAIQASAPGYAYTARSDLGPVDDVRDADRYLRWELTPVDFGHGVHASLSAKMARNLAVGIAARTVDTEDKAAAYRVEPPYTPRIKSLRAAYSTSVEIVPSTMTADHQILHVHPFGASPIDAARPSALPRYDHGGELYLGIRDLRPPQHLALLFQLAEGTSDPDLEPVPVTWSYLDGDRFVDLPRSAITSDTTRGLINSGIVELALPAAGVGGRLPADLYWLRIAIARNPTSVCDVVAVRSQAVSVVFEDRGNVPAHYEQPLPVGAIDRLLDPDAAIALVEQPYSSTGGRPAEHPGSFDTRVSERLRHKNRALTAWDYERLVLHEFRQIFKAKCLAMGGSVDVVVIPDVRELHPADTFAPKAPANLLADIRDYLVARAPAVARIRVRNAQYVFVQVRLGVRFRDGVDAGSARRRLDEELVRFLSPWAFDDGAELVIGGRIYANSILDFVDRRDYVDFAADIELFRSRDGKDYDLVPRTTSDYHVETDRPDQVLVTAQQHYFDVISDTEQQQTSFIGVNYARVELDFIVG